MAMKFGGLTWWRNNYGSILQAYALQEELKKYEGIEYEIICQYGKKIASASNFWDKLKKIGLCKTLNRMFWKFGFPGLRRRNQKIQSFVDQHLQVSQRQYSEQTIAQANDRYDGFLCGSDQIWNPKLTGLHSMYWLGFAGPAKRKIAYAPSIGVDRVSDDQAETIRQNLASFSAISAREESGTMLLNRILGKECCITVLDPTMLVDRSLWDAMSDQRKYTEPYVFAYMLRGNKAQRKLIEKFASSKHLKIVTMPFLDTEKIELYDFRFGDVKYWDAGPQDFISVIRHAEYVFTDSFHSTVFSCLYHRPFFVFPKIGPAQINRLLSLQQMLQTGDRILQEKDFSVEAIESKTPIDWNRVDEILARERKRSSQYLRDALKPKWEDV